MPAREHQGVPFDATYTHLAEHLGESTPQRGRPPGNAGRGAARWG
jgi:hypothetical protein